LSSTTIGRLRKRLWGRFTALDICKFTATWFVSCSLL
jgi:hypothetical protein